MVRDLELDAIFCGLFGWGNLICTTSLFGRGRNTRRETWCANAKLYRNGDPFSFDGGSDGGHGVAGVDGGGDGARGGGANDGEAGSYNSGQGLEVQ